LGRDRVRMAEVSPSEALRTLAWAGASGGAHARRPGAAAGRFAAWWAGAALTGLLEEWPVDAATLGDALTRLRWYAWDSGGAAIEALERTTGRPLVWATAQYLSYARPPSVVDIAITEIVRGHRSSQARAVARVDGEEIFTVNGALGARDFPLSGSWAIRPDVP